MVFDLPNSHFHPRQSSEKGLQIPLSSSLSLTPSQKTATGWMKMQQSDSIKLSTLLLFLEYSTFWKYHHHHTRAHRSHWLNHHKTRKKREQTKSKQDSAYHRIQVRITSNNSKPSPLPIDCTQPFVHSEPNRAQVREAAGPR